MRGGERIEAAGGAEESIGESRGQAVHIYRRGRIFTGAGWAGEANSSEDEQIRLMLSILYDAFDTSITTMTTSCKL